MCNLCAFMYLVAENLHELAALECNQLSLLRGHYVETFTEFLHLQYIHK